MATTFFIHQDENAKVNANGKAYHDVKNGSTRSVLGEVQNIKRKPLSVKNVNDDSTDSSISTGFIENIKALGLKDKPHFLKPDITGSFKDLKKTVKETSETRRTEIKTSSSFSVYTDKENLSSVVTTKSKAVEAKDKVIFQDETANLCFPESSSSDCDLELTYKESSSDPDSSNSEKCQPDIVKDDHSVSETPKISRLELSSSCIDSWYETLHYKDDIFKYLLSIEKKFQPSAYYMRRQPQITHSMRTILVDWLVEVAEEYTLVNETIYIAVSLVDRFLTSMAITKEKLQLLGTAAMWLAAKYEEVYPPSSAEFVYITDDSYTLSQLIRMERLLMKVLNFDISCPTIYHFLLFLLNSDKGPTKIMYLAMYISELTLLDAEPYLEFFPSLIASGAVVLARHCLDCKDIWPASYVKLTGYTLSQLVPVINHLNETHQRSFTRSHQAIRQKYATAKYRFISTIPFRKLTLRES